MECYQKTRLALPVVIVHVHGHEIILDGVPDRDHVDVPSRVNGLVQEDDLAEPEASQGNVPGHVNDLGPGQRDPVHAANVLDPDRESAARDLDPGVAVDLVLVNQDAENQDPVLEQNALDPEIVKSRRRKRNVVALDHGPEVNVVLIQRFGPQKNQNPKNVYPEHRIRSPNVTDLRIKSLEIMTLKNV